MHFTQKLLAIVAGAALTFAPSVALAEGQVPHGAPPASMSRTGRAFTYVVPVVRTLTSPGVAGICTVLSSTVAPTTAAEVSAIPAGKSGDMGRDGWVMDAQFNSPSITWTSSIGTPMYPGPLLIDFADNGTAGTLACTSLTLTGYRWDGMPKTEIIAPLSETARYTTNGWSSLTSVAARGCSGGTGDGGAFDRLRLRNSNFVSLPVRVKTITDIDAICSAQLNSNFTVVTAGASYQKCYTPTTTNTLTSLLTEAANAIAVLKPSNSMTYANLTSTGQGCAADRSTITIRGRASPYAFNF